MLLTIWLTGVGVVIVTSLVHIGQGGRVIERWEYGVNAVQGLAEILLMALLWPVLVVFGVFVGIRIFWGLIGHLIETW